VYTYSVLLGVFDVLLFAATLNFLFTTPASSTNQSEAFPCCP
jgi:uncharacterized membrane protein YkgB